MADPLQTASEDDPGSKDVPTEAATAQRKPGARAVPHLTRSRAGGEGEGGAGRGAALDAGPDRFSRSRVTRSALLEEQAVTRVPELVPIRYGRMLVSPFAFYRGGALIMAADLARTPRSGLRVQLCGDAHLSNFGVFGSPERSLVFDINDFDETAPGPVGVGREAAGGQLRGRRPRERVLGAGAARGRARHRTRVPGGDGGFAAMRNLDVWYSHLSVEQAVTRVQRPASTRSG